MVTNTNNNKIIDESSTNRNKRKIISRENKELLQQMEDSRNLNLISKNMIPTIPDLSTFLKIATNFQNNNGNNNNNNNNNIQIEDHDSTKNFEMQNFLTPILNNSNNNKINNNNNNIINNNINNINNNNNIATTNSSLIYKKRERTQNWAHQEKKFLLDLCRKDMRIIENKRLDAGLTAIKNKAWKIIHQRFSLTFGTDRTCNRLKEQWRRMKACTRNEIMDYNTRVARFGQEVADRKRPSPFTFEIWDFMQEAKRVCKNEALDGVDYSKVPLALEAEEDLTRAQEGQDNKESGIEIDSSNTDTIDNHISEQSDGGIEKNSPKSNVGLENGNDESDYGNKLPIHDFCDVTIKEESESENDESGCAEMEGRNFSITSPNSEYENLSNININHKKNAHLNANLRNALNIATAAGQGNSSSFGAQNLFPPDPIHITPSFTINNIAATMETLNAFRNQFYQNHFFGNNIGNGNIQQQQENHQNSFGDHSPPAKRLCTENEDHNRENIHAEMMKNFMEMQTKEHSLRMQILEVQLQTAKYNRDIVEVNKAISQQKLKES